MEILKRLQSPQTAVGKSIRDGVFVAMAAGVIVFFESIDKINFGEYNALATAVIGLLIAWTNRIIRK